MSRACRRAAIRRDPDSAKGRHEQARSDRDVIARAGDDGMAELRATMPADNVEAIMTADLSGHGPVTAEIARRMANDPTGTWRRIIADPCTWPTAGLRLDLLRTTQHLRDLVIIRDQVCIFPGCNQPAWHADIDHRAPFDEDGPTAEHNLGCLCRRHHICKTFTGWSYKLNGDRTVTCTAPTGHTYLTSPPHDWSDQVASASRPPPDPDEPPF